MGGLTEVDVPLLAVAGAGDLQDPVWACRKLFEQYGAERKQFLCLGRSRASMPLAMSTCW